MSIPIAQNLPTDLAKALRPLRSSAVKSQSALAEVVPQTGCRPGDLATFPRAGERKFCAPWMQRPSVLAEAVHKESQNRVMRPAQQPQERREVRGHLESVATGHRS